MHGRIGYTLLLVLAVVRGAGAQHGTEPQALRTAPSEARQFAFLIGQYDLVVKPAAKGLAARIHGVPKMVGTWKGSRALDGFGVQDELRVTDASGNPRLLAHAVRYYDGTARHWITSTIDVYRGVFTPSTSEWRDNVMTATSKGTDDDGKPYVTRSKYFDITPNAFRFQQDRSTDGGKTWDEATLIIEATRVSGAGSRE
jgi:hypothetical protein